MIIDFHNDKGFSVQVVNMILDETAEETRKIEETLEILPLALASHENLRNILRCFKRTGNLEKSIEKYAFNACPAEEREGTCYNATACSTCWMNYIMKIKESGISYDHRNR